MFFLTKMATPAFNETFIEEIFFEGFTQADIDGKVVRFVGDDRTMVIEVIATIWY